MDWLNYHHLLYFWTVAREGSIARATEKLNLTQPTISAQIRQLEESLGEKLFEKSGRGLTLTEAGKIAFRYADEIFALGSELRDTLRDRPTGKPRRVTVGVADVVPKLVAYRVLRPAFELAEPVEVICREASSEKLIAELALHEIDLVITDTPAAGANIHAHNHFLGESATTLFAAPALAARYRKNFPRSLHGAPMLLPAVGTQLRRALEQWLEANELEPLRAGHFDDTALMTQFGYGGVGIVAAPSVIEDELQRQFGLQVVGKLPDVRERFYAIAPQRKIRNPIVGAITSAARRSLFEGGGRGSTR